MKNLRASTVLLWAALAEYIAMVMLQVTGEQTTFVGFIQFGATLLLIWGAWEWEQERKAIKKAAAPAI